MTVQVIGNWDRRRVSIGFLNWAHAIDHYVLLIFPTLTTLAHRALCV